MSNPFVEQLRQKAKFELRYDSFGSPVSVIIFTNNSSTIIPKGNDNFSTLIEYIDSNNMRPKPKINWVQVVRDSGKRILYYKCDQGNFIDDNNHISNQIRQGIESESIEVQEVNNLSPVVELQASIFLPRTYSICDIGLKTISRYDFEPNASWLTFKAKVSLMQSIEADYFENQNFLQQQLKNLSGNIIRIHFTSRQIKSVYNRSKSHLDDESLLQLNDSMQADIALHKRSLGQGPTTNWYFDSMALHTYIWVPILEITNILIGLINHQAHRKTTALFSRDDLGDVVCIKAISADGTSLLWPLSNLRDQQVSLFPFELNWEHNLLDRSFNKVRYLMDRSLYFEAIVVAQAILEAIINGMFPLEIKQRCFIKWEQKYWELKRYYNESGSEFMRSSALYSYLDGGLDRIYLLRNNFAHDIFEKQPNYEFNLSELKEITQLLKPFTDTWENKRFMNSVSEMYRLQTEFYNSLPSYEKPKN